MAKYEFATQPGNDGREWDCACARCGSSTEGVSESCPCCGGFSLGEDDPWDICPECGDYGEVTWHRCLSSPEWCEANPLPSREKVERGTIEWFPLEAAAEGPW